jgi:Putative MetA-pathway of phenol degradation
MRTIFVSTAFILGTAGNLRGQVVTWGAIGGAAGLRSAASMQAASALFELKPVPWLTLSANPSIDHVTVPSTTGGGSVSSTGPTDLPLGIDATHELSHAPLSPTFGAGLELSLPTGSSTTGLGSGQTGLAGELGAGISPADNLSLDLNLWHPFAGDGANAALDAPRATSIDLEAGYDWSDRVATSVGYSTDVGPADSGAVLPQSIAAGFVLAFAKPLALTVNGARGITSGAPRWLVSVGIGTAFSGINPVGPNSLFGRLRHGLGRGADRGKGKGKVGK